MDYPAKLQTLGDHLRKARIDRKLSQRKTAKLMEVSPMALLNWELNHTEPRPKYAGKIISFLGYIPETWKAGPLHKRMYYARLGRGWSQEQLATAIGSDTSNLSLIELGKRQPYTNLNEKLEVFISEVFSNR